MSTRCPSCLFEGCVGVFRELGKDKSFLHEELQDDLLWEAVGALSHASGSRVLPIRAQLASLCSASHDH